ncbi:MAG: hypothetical protein K9I95_14535 [Flavobacteriaceae bacterium]|nr:hypothetical protein [Flavobacteriaceae bacterium]
MTVLRIIFIELVVCLLLALNSNAQQRTIDGYITDQFGIPLENLNVKLNTVAGEETVTDENGYYTLITANFPTGINEITSDHGFSVYPNPTGEETIIELKEDNGFIEVISASGQLLNRINLLQEKRLDIKNVPLVLITYRPEEGLPISKKLILSQNKTTLKVRYNNQLKSAEIDTFNYKLQVSGNAYGGELDTTLNISGFNKETNSHSQSFALQTIANIYVSCKFFDPKTRWNKPDSTDGSTWTRKTPTGITDPLAIEFYIDGQLYNATVKENGIAEMATHIELDNNPDSVKINGGEKYYLWGRNDIVIVKGINEIKACNDPDGVPMIKRDSLAGSTNQYSERADGMDFLEYVKRLAGTPRGGGQFRFFVSSLNQPFPIKWDPTKSIIRTELPGVVPNFIEEIDSTHRDYYIAGAREVAQMFTDEVPLINFEEINANEENINQIYIPINFKAMLTGQTSWKPEWSQIHVRGQPNGVILEPNLNHILVHEMNRGIGTVTGESPYIEDAAYRNPDRRRAEGIPVELSNREKKYYTFILEDMYPGFRMGDYSK